MLFPIATKLNSDSAIEQPRTNNTNRQNKIGAEKFLPFIGDGAGVGGVVSTGELFFIAFCVINNGGPRPKRLGGIYKVCQAYIRTNPSCRFVWYIEVGWLIIT